eukprot:COSAG04_NODE_6019_length_1430_cov_4.415477_2_plen_277_part_01
MLGRGERLAVAEMKHGFVHCLVRVLLQPLVLARGSPAKPAYSCATVDRFAAKTASQKSEEGCTHVAWPGPALGSDCMGMIGVAKFSSFPAPRRFKELWAVGSELPEEAVEASSQHVHLLSLLFRARSSSSTEVDKRRRWAALLRVHTPMSRVKETANFLVSFLLLSRTAETLGGAKARARAQAAPRLAAPAVLVPARPDVARGSCSCGPAAAAAAGRPRAATSGPCRADWLTGKDRRTEPQRAARTPAGGAPRCPGPGPAPWGPACSLLSRLPGLML